MPRQDGLGDDGLAHDRRRLRQRHRRDTLEHSLARPHGTVVMKGMSQFVSQCRNLVERTIKIGQHARLAHSRHLHAKGATTLSRSRRHVDPVAGKGPLGQIRQFGRKPAKGLVHQLLGLIIAIGALAVAHWGKQVPPR